MSLGAWGDEGDVCDHGRDTAMYQDLLPIIEKYRKWLWDNKDEFYSDNMTQFAESILDKLDELKRGIDVPL